MNLKELQYFIRVIELGNFTDAADICCVTQPTLSAGIKKLEDELGVQLIIRGTKNTGGIRPTVYGNKILEIARHIDTQAEKIKRLAKQSLNPFSGDLRVGAFPTICSYIFPRFLPVLKQNFTDITFYLTEEKTDILLDLFQKDNLDMIFLATQIPENLSVHGKYKKINIFFDPFFLAIPADHDLAVQKTIDTHILTDLDLLLLDEGHCLRTQALEVCKYASNRSAAVDFRATSLETLIAMVKMGTGCTLVPKTLVNHDDKAICYLPLSDPHIGRCVDIIFNTQTMHKDLIQRIINIIDNENIFFKIKIG